jgi:hypothetical protein
MFVSDDGKQDFRRTGFGSRLLTGEGEGGGDSEGEGAEDRFGWGWGVCLKWSNILLVVSRSPRLKSLRRNSCYPIRSFPARTGDFPSGSTESNCNRPPESLIWVSYFISSNNSNKSSINFPMTHISYIKFDVVNFILNLINQTFCFTLSH